MDQASIARYITDTFPDARPIEAWGDTFFYYRAEGTRPDDIYFATLKSSDDDYDRASDLDRPSVFRLSIGISKSTFRTMFGPQPSRPAPGETVDTGHDFSALDRLMPHPLYGYQSWVFVLNPSEATLESVRPLLAEAHDLAADRYAKREARRVAPAEKG